MDHLIEQAVAAVHAAFQRWSAASLEDRIALLNSFADQLRQRKAELAETICREIGKPRWESSAEVDSMIGKVEQSIDSYRQRRAVTTREVGGAAGVTRYKPHGVVAVLGPFNMPGHLPNGHIVPALLAGNTVVFKPSEHAPLVAQQTLECWLAAGLPPGVVTLLQGGRETGAALASHPGIDGLFFTGSFAAGQALNRSLADDPGKIVALEMGGNNPLIVHQVSNLDGAAYATIQSAYITSGQRCSCARRLILPPGNEQYLQRLVAMIGRIRVGAYTQIPEPFMGPVISDSAATRLLDAQTQLLNSGGKPLAQMRPMGPQAMLSPGLIDVTNVNNRPDEEFFGPLLQLIRVHDFDTAIAEANRTRYGLAAGLLSDDRALWDQFYCHTRAGVVNWNRPLTGASGYLPFGGVGCSGNNRPSGYFAADYCSYPVASLESPSLSLPATLAPGISMP